jgi:cytochrome c oxidase cbb3-type subunit III
LRRSKVVTLGFFILGISVCLRAQSPSSPPTPQAPTTPATQTPTTTAPDAGGRGGRGGRGGAARPSAYPVRAAADPAVVDRGKAIFIANCSFCHGSDARGGEGGPNLIRSQVVMDDTNGENIATVVQNGRPGTAMPKFDLSLQDISAIAAFIHSFPVGGRAATTGTVDPLVGDAKAGEAYFNGAGKCAACHSATGDLAGVASKYADPRALQGAILSGQGGRGVAPANPALAKTVTVTFPSGKAEQGTLVELDDFIVAFTDADGNRVSIKRDGEMPKVVVKNPLQPHLDMLGTFKDDDIHNLTAYLVTLK